MDTFQILCIYFYLAIHDISHANYPGDEVLLSSRHRSEVLQRTETKINA